MVGSSPFFEDHFFLDHPWDQKEEEANDNLTDQEIEPESSIEDCLLYTSDAADEL